MKTDNSLVRLKKRIGANGPGLSVAVIAMLVALTGGAFAASGALTSTQKKEVKKIAKQFAGKPGAIGATGPQGSPGAPGAKGDKGDTGEKGLQGDPGTPGAPGTNGKSVEVTPILEGEAGCEERGGALVQEEEAVSGAEVCNGENGEKGEKGEPWAPNNTLPPGATETGSWAFTAMKEDKNSIRVPISFPVQFPFALSSAHVHFSTEEGFGTPCPGTASIPTAAPGELCVYVNTQAPLQGTSFEGIFKIAALSDNGANRSGAMLIFSPPTAEAAGSGSFAVQGCARKTTEPPEPGLPECP